MCASIPKLSLSSRIEQQATCYVNTSHQKGYVRDFQKRRRTSECSVLSAVDDQHKQSRQRLKQKQIQSRYSARHVSLFMVVVCWILPHATSEDAFVNVVDFPQRIRPEQNVERFDFVGGLVLPSLFSNSNLEIDVTPSPLGVPPPTVIPSRRPTRQPTPKPTKIPTNQPTRRPITDEPTRVPTKSISEAPTFQPSLHPQTSEPTRNPTVGPSSMPSLEPVSKRFRWW
jgi:hypothetical protein